MVGRPIGHRPSRRVPLACRTANPILPPSAATPSDRRPLMRDDPFNRIGPRADVVQDGCKTWAPYPSLTLPAVKMDSDKRSQPPARASASGALARHPCRRGVAPHDELRRTMGILNGNCRIGYPNYGYLSHSNSHYPFTGICRESPAFPGDFSFERSAFGSNRMKFPLNSQ